MPRLSVSARKMVLRPLKAAQLLRDFIVLPIISYFCSSQASCYVFELRMGCALFNVVNYV